MSRPLRVWLPAVRAGSGADVFVERLATGLAKAGHEPAVQWFAHDREWRPWTLQSAVMPPGTDVIHAGSWQGFAFRRPGVPLVVTEHQYIRHPAFLPHRRMLQSLYHDMFVRRWVDRSHHAADALVAVSEHTARVMRSDLQRPVHLINNWVDTDLFAPTPKPKRVAGLPFRLLFVGNPSRWKGADVLPILARQLGPGFDIQCLGGLRGAFSQKRLAPGMSALQPVDPAAMPAIYHSVDAVLVPTRYEAFGYVALEAMACGLPVLGFASTGTAEVCADGETALLAPMEDIDGLVHRARQLADNPVLCARLGEAGRLRAIASFSEDRALSSYIALYESLIEAGPHG
ncbi:glycosyltransferase family 4 protein [Dyella jiangningensis]|uniref:glycosyltransferase family 4 protein n=1 Tax=Dyella jiangningensis TaxID=1379159 RepID=UPI00240F50C1|nr:glycosyltransferase family 4 protein [Dyella jiangningensis]MDG2537163.1 glycosyltransferase family 4 protein [Dyella jiangningensis]